jgi:class 3 adenylate cyclase
VRSSAKAAGFLVDGLQRLVNIALTLLIAGSLVLFALKFIHAPGVTQSWPALRLHRFGDPAVLWLTRIAHLQGLESYVPLLLAALFYALTFVSDRFFGVLRGTVHRSFAALRAAALKSDKAPPPAASPSVDSEKARAELFQAYRNIEQTLKSAKAKRCAFLAIDIVGSTSMKAGESEIAIHATFRAYEEILKRTFKATKAWKETWTPDGVMICFLNREDAVSAAQRILERLLAFNQHDNALKTPIEVRCGVNEGDVVIFDDSDLAKIVDRTIDVAGHMQKYAKPGTLRLSKELCGLLENPAGFVPAGEDVDGYETYEWSPKPLQ